ncbi:MAG: HAD-IA family hydrolase [Janthinobacterium lividum]
MSIRAVIFDADGVIVFPWRFGEHLSREYQITQEATQAFFQGKFTECLVGKANLSHVLPSYLEEWGWSGSVEEFMQLWFTVEDAIDVRVLDAAETLRDAGLVCCLASNQEQHRADFMRTSIGFSGQFDVLFFSCEIGFKKPDDRFYAAVEAALGLTGNEIAFWDDTRSHVEAAQKRGWAAELYTGYDGFSRQARELLERQTTL